MNEKAPKSTTRAPDPRPARTRAAILAAIEQLGSKGSEISVSAVVIEAGLSRSSFYSQFKDMGDVAVQLLRELYERPEPPQLSPEGDGSSPIEILSATALLLHEMQERRYLYASVLGSSAAISAQWEVCEILAQGVLRSIGGIVPEHIDSMFAARYIASGYLANIVEWLTSENPVSADVLEQQLRELLPGWVVSELS